MMTKEEWEKYEIDRLVALWILADRKGVETPKVQAWLIENGYKHLIPQELLK